MEDFKKALTGALGRKYIDSIVEQVINSPARFADLYALTKHEDEKIAWRATWACEKLSIELPSLLMDLREELMQRSMQCPHGGIRRLLLNAILHLPVLEPINVPFLDFCLNGMLSPAESVAGQAVCMKLAYALCLKEPELMSELQAYLENMEPEYYTAAVQCTRNNILKKIRK
ncbi:hypothetical protein [Phocaeicola sp.]